MSTGDNEWINSISKAHDGMNSTTYFPVDSLEQQEYRDFPSPPTESQSYSEGTVSSSKPVVSIARRNERERKRVRLVNQGFAILRDRVPRERCNRGRRSSKVETLRAAIMYIRQLQQLLMEHQLCLQNQTRPYCYSQNGTTTTMVSGNYPFADGVHVNTFQQCSSNIQYPNDLFECQLPQPWFT